LLGLEKGEMTYEKDPLMPMLTAEINKRTKEFQGLSPEEESKLLRLSND